LFFLTNETFVGDFRMSQDDRTGILPSQAIEHLVSRGVIRIARSLDGDQIQPASLDLRLGTRAYRIRASFLPGPNSAVADRLQSLALHEIDLTRGAVLETGCVYLVELMEGLALRDGISATCNPKSSTGRLDVFTRVIVDQGQAFDTIPAGYEGPLFLEISPQTFPVLVRTGSRLSQIRFRRGRAELSIDEVNVLQETERLVDTGEPVVALGGIAVSIDLMGEAWGGLLGYRAKRHSSVIDVDKKAAADVLDFWEPIQARGKGEMILDPDEFYILASKEAVVVPPAYAAEMVPFDPLVGEFRAHYAGFFDPGFGHATAGGRGARAVLEVRSREVPFILEHGQIVARLVYEHMIETPKSLYGEVGSNYQAQGLKLSKHFR
jgi:dCTP deaminase